MPIPLAALGAASIGSKLLKGFFGGRAKKKQAEAEAKEAARVEGLQKGQFEAGQARRGAKLNAIQGQLQRMGGLAPEGTPDYSFDPAVLAEIQKALPFAPGRALPTGETGESMLGEAAGTIGGAADTALLGQSFATPAAGAAPEVSILEGSPMGGEVGAVEGGVNWDEILKRAGF